MELTFTCPKCGEERRKPDAESGTLISCPDCGYAGLLPPVWTLAGRVERCPICGVDELYRQRDFDQKLGIIILVVGAAFALVTFALSLLAAAILDLILYVTSPQVLICYSCRTRIHGHRPSERHRPFDPQREQEVRSRARRAGKENTPR